MSTPQSTTQQVHQSLSSPTIRIPFPHCLAPAAATLGGGPAGPALLRESLLIKPADGSGLRCPPGQARITNAAGRLRARFVVHAVGPYFPAAAASSGGGGGGGGASAAAEGEAAVERLLLAAAYRDALRLAAAAAARSVGAAPPPPAAASVASRPSESFRVVPSRSESFRVVPSRSESFRVVGSESFLTRAVPMSVSLSSLAVLPTAV